jgi:CubicO group peptidase (beta-lactamase class C family)
LTRLRILHGGRRFRWLWLLLLALIVGAGVLRMQSRPELTDASLGSLSEANGVCVAAVATLRRAVVDVVQTSRCESSQALSEPVVFQAASLGKPVFAYAVLKLVEEGRFDLDAPLARYLPAGYVHLQQPFDPGESAATDLLPASQLRKVTARQVLTHTSGLPNWADGTLDFEFQPGSAWRYSGEGYLLLQSAVEAASGADFNAFMQARVFEPLAMTDSSYVWVDGYQRRFASGFLSNGQEARGQQFHSAVSAATLYTTAEDYARFFGAVLADPQAVRTIRDAPVEVAPELGFAWGLGWGLWQGEGEEFIWHWGDNPGFKAFAVASLRTGDGVVILTNSDDGLELAEAVIETAMTQATGVFRFYMLRNGMHRVVCRKLGWCF